jgi:UDP-2,4-diacetamido-2,4,6-trideoxy-beta-L-altropyranose hydrolase
MQSNFLMYKLTILTESGKDIGFGHLTRCSALYLCLIKHGFNVRFYVYEKEYYNNDSFIISFDWINEIDQIIPRSRDEIVLIDSYLADINIFLTLKEKFEKLIVIDDYNRITYPANFIINPNVFSSQLNYSNQNAKVFGGKEFVILRHEFLSASILIPQKKDDFLNLLVTIGGSDFRNLLPELLSILNKIEINSTIISPEGNIESNSNIKIIGKQFSNQMVREINKADIVISACGQTLHELVALGKPTIGICLDIDQIPNQNYYFENAFLKEKIFWNDFDLKKKILNQINYFKNFENRLEIFQKCSSLIDKNGVNKIVESIKKMYDKFQ